MKWKCVVEVELEKLGAPRAPTAFRGPLNHYRRASCRQPSANQCIGETDQPLCTCTSAGAYCTEDHVVRAPPVIISHGAPVAGKLKNASLRSLYYSYEIDTADSLEVPYFVPVRSLTRELHA
ncbi:hypothetical protein TgHK011_008705 [Trichoderma gracile]|nr:hypothetical protein TgHK011_008705 [Trichoderma gracile]